MLPDAAHIQEKDHRVPRAARQGRPGQRAALHPGRRGRGAGADGGRAVPPDHPPPEAPRARVRRGRAHPRLRLGRPPDHARAVNHRIVFSGDIGRSGLPIIRDPEPPVGPDRHADRRVHLRRPGPRVGGRRRGPAGRGGPAHRGARRQGAHPGVRAGAGAGAGLRPACSSTARAGFPTIPIYVDSPLAVDTTTVFRMHPEVFDEREQLVADNVDAVRLLRWCATCGTWRTSKALNELRGPGRSSSPRAAWRSRAGSCTTWRTASATIATWCSSSASRRSTRSAAGSRAARRSSASWARTIPRRAEVETIGGYSAHADRNELRAWVRRLGGPIRRAFVVHGEAPALGAMATILREEGVREVILPKHGEAFDL